MKLPNDPVSIDNAIIMKKSRRFPLLIDPQDQALIYIKNLESNRKLLILKPSTPAQEVLFKLETCLQLGMPVLL
jgi:dynein heavy chain